jgi:cysteine desulfurase
MRPVYLDHNATTPLSRDVLTAMEPYLLGQYGNPLTSHQFGDSPRAAVAAARDEILTLLGAAGGGFRVLFNSGATEGLNHAVKGIAFASLVDGRAGPRNRIVIGALEHYAVAKPAVWLADHFGFEVVKVAPGRDGVVSAERFLEAVDGDTTLLAALHWANNELGTIQPVAEIGRACRERGVPFVCDAVQVVGKCDASDAASFADVVALSAHKFYGPKGVGALLVRDGVELDPLLHGAQQEDGLRGGTHNVPGIAGIGAAARAARGGWAREAERVAGLRDQLWDALRERIHGLHWNGGRAPVLPNTLNVSFEGCPSAALCDALNERGFAISAGAACRSGAVSPSKNILSMGLSESRALTSVRISLGHDTTPLDVGAAADAFADAVPAVRAAH